MQKGLWLPMDSTNDVFGRLIRHKLFAFFYVFVPRKLYHITEKLVFFPKTFFRQACYLFKADELILFPQLSSSFSGLAPLWKK